MLWKFSQDHPTEVEAVYFVSGMLVNSRNNVIKLVPGAKLDDTKKLFSSLDSIHVHSLFKKITRKATQQVSVLSKTFTFVSIESIKIHFFLPFFSFTFISQHIFNVQLNNLLFLKVMV